MAFRNTGIVISCFYSQPDEAVIKSVLNACIHNQISELTLNKNLKFRG